MSSFRVIVYAPGEACVIGYSDAGDFVSAAQMARLLRDRGFPARPIVNTRSLHQQAEEWLAKHTAGIVHVPIICECGATMLQVDPPKRQEDPCDGK